MRLGRVKARTGRRTDNLSTEGSQDVHLQDRTDNELMSHHSETKEQGSIAWYDEYVRIFVQNTFTHFKHTVRHFAIPLQKASVAEFIFNIKLVYQNGLGLRQWRPDRVDRVDKV